MFWKKLSPIFPSIFFLFLITLSPAQAQSNSDYFDTKLHTTVTISDTGQSRIKHEFTITNKTPTTYISQYGLKISSSELKNVTAIGKDGQGIETDTVPIKNNQQSGPGQTSIALTFPDKIVGEGKTRQFTISYTHPDAAVISGRVLEVTLPPQANPQDYSEYSVTLVTPARFGGPVRTTPANHDFTANGNQIITTFKTGEERGVFALFGSQQLFDLNLSYYLENTTNNPGITQIALPPDTIFQKVFYHQLDPKPEKMNLDPDGNWIATYKLPANTNITVNLLATVKLTLEPNKLVPIPKPDNRLLKAQKFWPTNSPDFKKLAQDYTTPKKINDFVVNTLNYNTQIALGFPERLGAINALNNPDNAVCQEFTDLFITMARGTNIPARRITGYAYSQNSALRPLSLVEDILHAWPEYYDVKQGYWIPIDPTWENTTGGVDYFNQHDLNHIVFAINGLDSITPHPAGSYKKPGTKGKTVLVEFGTEFPQSALQLQLNLKPKKIFNLNIPGLYTLEITNQTGAAHYQLPLKISTTNSQIKLPPSTEPITALLPFQTQAMPLRIENKTGFLPSHDTIQIKVSNETQEFNVSTSPPLSQASWQKEDVLAVAGGAIFFSLIGGSLLVFRRKR